MEVARLAAAESRRQPDFFDSPKTLSAFALGLVLFIVTLIFNLVAINVVKRFREKYE